MGDSEPQMFHDVTIKITKPMVIMVLTSFFYKFQSTSKRFSQQTAREKEVWL
jgi:hypothetical protein